MANRYANLVGSNKIKDEYQKINQGFDKVEQEMDVVSAELNKKTDRAFAQVNDLAADTKADTITFEGGTGITITTNPNEKKVIVTATGTATPGAHGSAHTEFGADPIPLATPTEGGLMSAADKAALENMKRINVKNYGAKGDGVTDDTNALLSAIEASPNDGSVFAFPTGTYRIASDITIPSHITLWFMTGAKLLIDNGVTVTINGSIEAGLYQIFSGEGTISGTPKVEALIPNWWGENAAAIQSAIQLAISSRNSVKFCTIIDITGSSVVIDKPPTDRTILYLIGEGGGIRKDDPGYIFTTNLSYSGDIVSKGMKYQSVAGAGTIVWNGNGVNGLIRIGSLMDSYVDVDTILEGNGSYVQSARFIGCTITGGEGWAFEWKKSYDTSIVECTIEHRENGIRNSYVAGNPDNDNLRIVNNVIEGLTGKAVELGSSFSVLIQGNYFEENEGGYVDLSVSSDYHNGLVLIGNSFQQTSGQITSGTPGFKIARMGSNGVFSAGNVATGTLFEIVFAGTPGQLVSASDISYNGNKFTGTGASTVSEIGMVKSASNSRSYGRISQYRFSSESTSFAAGETKEVTISTTGITFNGFEIVTFTFSPSGSNAVAILSYRISGTDIIVRVKNESTGSQNITTHATILQIG